MSAPRVSIPAYTRVGSFRFGSIAAGIRADGRDDLALVLSEAECVSAGVLTRNVVRAAPVQIMARRLGRQRTRGILVNSGCANACTGEAGMEEALRGCGAIAEAAQVPEDSLLPASTGVIGSLLPADRIVAQAQALAASLTPTGWAGFARAIMTTDRWPKLAYRKLPGSDDSPSVLCIAKGAGMVHPDLGPPQATMLAFAFTDAVVEAHTLSKALHAAVDTTFNACSVDGDTSTNDCVVALASGTSGQTPAPSALTGVLESAFDELARSMLADGEGAEHVAEIHISGLASEADARSVARTVATSQLVKTALFGKDINWGRLMGAAGRAGVRFNPDHARIWVGDVLIVDAGVAVGAEAEAKANRILAEPSYVISMELGDGASSFRYLTSDLGHGYVDVNAGYRS